MTESEAIGAGLLLIPQIRSINSSNAVCLKKTHQKTMHWSIETTPLVTCTDLEWKIKVTDTNHVSLNRILGVIYEVTLV